ncbi:MAG: HAD-IA family hydrolase [Anaerolineaceae bacterium]|nr:HAD-IA family hydrolase [Anaerolineaceae bacterium]
MSETDHQITALFLDVGGVLLANAWDTRIRRNACEAFNLDFEDMNERHHLSFDTYELGKLSLEEYLNRVIFYREQTFSRQTFKNYMFAQAKPNPDMISFISQLKEKYHLKIAVVSNEGRELMVDRIQRYHLDRFVDFFIASSFVHYRKPDQDIYNIALDIAQVSRPQIVYIEDRPLFVEVARSLDIHTIQHVDFSSTRQLLAEVGLSLD